MRYVHLGWSDIEKLVDAICRQIRADHGRFDCILAVLRGGVVPARLLADRLGTDIAMATVGIKGYDGVGRKSRSARITSPLPSRERVRAKRILAVDDISDSGRTASLLLRHIRQQGPASVATATLFWKEGSSFKPDYFGATARPGCWIVFPWERDEFRADLRRPVNRTSRPRGRRKAPAAPRPRRRASRPS